MFKINKTSEHNNIFNQVLNSVPSGNISNITIHKNEITFNVPENNIFNITTLLIDHELIMSFTDIIEPVQVQ